MGRILVGTASWTDKSLLKSGWYPPDATSAEARLKFYASQFPLVEVDSTYYYPPRKDVVQLWTQRTPSEFTFDIKAFSLLTSIRPGNGTSGGTSTEGKERVYPKDRSTRTLVRQFGRCSSMRSIRCSGAASSVLCSSSSRPGSPSGARTRTTSWSAPNRAQPRRISVEFRHQSWMTEENREETLEFLRQHDLAYVCVDMPQGFRSSIPPVVAATSPELGLARFHGRNREEWESGSVQRRFRYLYSERELEDWVPRIRALAEETESTHVVMNNCYEDYAQRNGADLARMLEAG